MVLVVVKKTEQDFADALRDEASFISSMCRVDDKPIRLDAYQLAFLQNRKRFRWVTKSRQVGYSFLFALETLSRCHLRDNYTAVHVSYALEDAKNKIAMAQQFYNDLPLAFQKKLITDNKTELAFQSNASHKRISRMFSNPSKAPRGRTGDVYLDELAHYPFDRAVYTGSTAVTLRTSGQLTGASSPLGRRGIFWEIATEEVRPYPHHSRQVVPWWLCRFFCTDVVAAAREAPHMGAEERVSRFGTPGIVEQFDSLALDEFQQEFECVFCDESFSYYPYDLILPCTSDDVTPAEDVSDVRNVKGRVVAGFDVGRTRDRSELVVLEQRGEQFVTILMRSYEKATFAAQEGELRRLLNGLSVARLSIDCTGIGMNLAENLGREFPQVVPETFTNTRKEQWATDFKILLQRRELLLPKDRTLVAQIHSIKRHVLPSGKVAFESERSRQHGHADKFWAVALACQQERGSGEARVADVGVRILGGGPANHDRDSTSKFNIQAANDDCIVRLPPNGLRRGKHARNRR